MSDANPNTFEAKLQRIDQIAKELESNQVPLEKSIELFKEAKKLTRECEALLLGAQETIDKAMADDKS